MIKYMMKAFGTCKCVILILLVLGVSSADVFSRFLVGNLFDGDGVSVWSGKIAAALTALLLVLLFRMLLIHTSANALTSIKWNLRSVLEHCQIQRASTADNIQAGKLLNNILNAQVMTSLGDRLLVRYLPVLISFLITLIIFFVIHPFLAIAALVCALIPIPYISIVSKKMEKAYADYFKKKDELLENENNRLVNLELIKLIKAESKVASEHRQYLKETDSLNRKAAAKESVLSMPTLFFSFLAMIILGSAGGVLYGNQQISLGELMTVFLLVDMILDPVMMLDSTILLWKKALASYKRILPYLEDKASAVENKQTCQGASQEPLNSPICIEIRDLKVWFEEKAIQMNPICMKSGVLYVIQGQNGNGKSTLLRVLSGVIRDYEGTVFINGEDIQSWERARFVRYISACPQKTVLFPCSIRENLNLRDAQQASLCQAYLSGIGLEQELADLKDGLDTVLGENGAPLSAGQLQRLQIVRTLLKTDAEIFLFDEPTASFSGEEKEWFMKTIEKLAKRKLVLMVSHDERVPEGSVVYRIGA